MLLPRHTQPEKSIVRLFNINVANAFSHSGHLYTYSSHYHIKKNIMHILIQKLYSVMAIQVTVLSVLCLQHSYEHACLHELNITTCPTTRIH